VFPKPDLHFGKKQQARFQNHPWLQRLVRGGIYTLLESRALGFSGRVPSMQGSLEKQARKFLDAQVKDPVLRAKLTPNYRVGCKRILISNEYYAALQKPNAAVETSGIAEIREHSIVTQDGQEHPVDAIVFATGFQAAEAVAPFELRGRDGVDLNEVWRDGAEAYLGTTVTGFPNLFQLVGPNTGLGHNSMVYIIESQIQYVADALAKMRQRDVVWVDVKSSVQQRYNEELHERLSRTVWATGGCVSWYQTKTGKNTTLWPSFTFEFRRRTRKFDMDEYDVQAHGDVHDAKPAETKAAYAVQPAE
jgi:cation diffusion facilitator CzcD-associated flavoprotein CzcO